MWYWIPPPPFLIPLYIGRFSSNGAKRLFILIIYDKHHWQTPAVGVFEENGEKYGRASFSGKNTYLDRSMPEPEGNHESMAHTEDRNEPESGEAGVGV